MTTTSHRIRWAGVAAAAAFALASTGALAADAGKEMKTAATHAGYAAKSKALKGVKTHLHHAVNCLVGPDGDGFDKKAMNPCKGMGKGAINDAKDKKTKDRLQSALKIAMRGLKATKLSVAQADAEQVSTMLKKATKM